MRSLGQGCPNTRSAPDLSKANRWCIAAKFLRYPPRANNEAAMISRRTFLHSAAWAMLPGAGITAPAQAQSAYPDHPVRWIVPYAAGGATDVLSRLICQRLSDRLGQP